MDYNRMMSMSMFLEKEVKPEKKFTYRNLLLPYGFLVKMYQNAISVSALECLIETSL